MTAKGENTVGTPGGPKLYTTQGGKNHKSPTHKLF